MTKYFVEVIAGRTRWYKDQQMKIVHREDGPAVIWADGSKHWYKDGLRHRKDGLRHRKDGPAIEWASGAKSWWVNGDLHREDGPAIEYSNGEIEYWLNGKNMTKAEWEAGLRPVEELTVGQIEQLLGKRIKIVKESCDD